jgi:hypothetical protein
MRHDSKSIPFRRVLFIIILFWIASFSIFSGDNASSLRQKYFPSREAINVNSSVIATAFHDNNNTPAYQVVETPIIAHDIIEEDRVHIMFSTDCTSFQHWQSLLLLHTAWRVGQRGSVS